jgi:hypothetical protein
VMSAWRRLSRHRRHLQACRNLPLLGRCADLAYVCGSDVVTIEFKLHDWKRALVQARDHQLASDFAYVCMPRRRVSEQLACALSESGVGLMFFMDRGEWPFETAIEARRSSDTWQTARSSALEYIRRSG